MRQAIATVAPRSPGPLRRIAGPSTRISAQSATPGEVGPDALAAMLDALRAELGRPGAARDVLGGVEWLARDSFGNVQVIARPHAGETRIRIAADRQETALVLGILLPMGGLIAGGIIASAIDAPAIPTVAAAAVAGLGCARWIWGRVARKWERRVARLTDRLVQVLRDSRKTPPDAG